MAKEKDSIFRMKQFALRHSAGSMKVGTDGVILGAWVDVPAGCRKILDAGTGSGLIAIMLAQRCPQAEIDAIEIEPAAAAEARENAAESPWGHRVNVYMADFASWYGHGYDLIVSNPPFFTESLHSPDRRRALARHEDSLSAHALIQNISMLAPGGRLAMILPADSDGNIQWLATIHHLDILRRTALAGSPYKKPIRTLWELSKSAPKVRTVTDRLDIRGADGEFTPEYRRLVSPFYINL